MCANQNHPYYSPNWKYLEMCCLWDTVHQPNFKGPDTASD